MDIYERISLLKDERKINYNDIAKIISKSSDAVRMAVKRKRLTVLEIEKIEEKFFNKKELTKREIELKETALFAIENWEEMKSVVAFKNRLELDISKRILHFQNNPGEFEKWKKNL